MDVQEDVQRTHLDMVKALPAGKAVPYMDGRGGLYQKLPLPKAHPNLGACRRASPATSLVPPGQAPFRVPFGFGWEIKPALYADTGLLARLRLHGLRLADRQWALSKNRGGTCISFACALRMHMYCT